MRAFLFWARPAEAQQQAGIYLNVTTYRPACYVLAWIYDSFSLYSRHLSIPVTLESQNSELFASYIQPTPPPPKILL